MPFKYLIQKREDDRWIDEIDIGLFDSIEDANDEIFMMVENKSDFWTDYRVVQRLIK